MNILIDIIERCHQRHKKSLEQRRTVATHVMYDKESSYQYTVYCAHKAPMLLSDLERANISFMPIGRAPHHDRGPWDYGGKRFTQRQTMIDWRMQQWETSWGIQVYTGIPSEHNGARWHDLCFKYDAICAAPEAIEACIEGLVNATTNPLLTITASGGLRFSCRIPNYLHPNTEEAKFYIYKHTPTSDNPQEQTVYLEFLGEEGYSCWDARQEIVGGNLLDPPVISSDALFAHIDTLRDELHEPKGSQEVEPKPVLQTSTVTPVTLGSQNLDLAKEALQKRSFAYTRQEDKIHYWHRSNGKMNTEEVSLWEDNGTVWIRASTPVTGLPTEPTQITDVWVDTGIYPKVSEKIIAIREGKLSPLAIKRPKPVLRRSQEKNFDYAKLEENNNKIQNLLDLDARILGLFTHQCAENYTIVKSYLNKGKDVCLFVKNMKHAKVAEQYFREQNLPSVAIWKSRNYRWKMVKDIHIEERMATPFKHGNVCEDAKRCQVLIKKGVDPYEHICLKCPVYSECTEQGYLAQTTNFKEAKLQIIPINTSCFDPKYTEFLNSIFMQTDETVENETGEDGSNRICILYNCGPHTLFPIYTISTNVLEEWSETWDGNVLGNFAKAILNVLQIRVKTSDESIKRVRATINAFRRHEKEIIRQMCHLNIKAKVVPEGIVDAATGKELAQYSIIFDGGTYAYIPLDNSSTDILTSKGLPIFELQDFVLNDDIQISMKMEQAITLGILNVETVESIESFPTVCHIFKLDILASTCEFL